MAHVSNGGSGMALFPPDLASLDPKQSRNHLLVARVTCIVVEVAFAELCKNSCRIDRSVILDA